MKKVGNILWDIIIFVWIFVAIFVTICLLSYNEFNIPKFGSHTLLIIDSSELEPDYHEGDLLIINRDNDSEINSGDKVFFYNGNRSNEYLINVGEVTNKMTVTGTESTFEINGSKVSGSYVMGKTTSTKILPTWGMILGIFTSQWGYMFLVIFPTLFAIIYEILMIVEASRELKEKDANNEKETVDA